MRRSGASLALLLGREPLWIAVPFTVLVAVAITWVRESTELGSDTAIGILFSVSVALGVVFLALRREYSADAFGVGSILAVLPVDLWVTGAVD
jgi:zinc transport system permease protein